MANNQCIQLKGRVFITFNIKAVTGLHIGGTESGIEIGGVDKTVIRDPLTNRPYIPGSSLKGKVRSLLEKYKGLRQNQRIGQGYIHSCDDPEEYPNCDVCQVFGVPGERDFATPTRLVVRDVMMTEESAKDLEVSGRTDLPYTEVKTEVSIDRVTSAANPRQMERVPAGTVFGLAEMVYSLYDGDGCNVQKDIERLRTLVEGLQLLEDDYLGGLGSRGSGKVKLQDINVTLRVGEKYAEEKQPLGSYENLEALVKDLKQIQDQIRQRVG
ncbi:type III-A CRISPR-associated RAMP protein Csm3 [Thermanaerothrix sp.]|jgi:CRISPR-associated protein Csm3|uniref:type III-A CRISPR-associated RAMP protein Csm3 n=1 Tax=Thermanaerothrix sp. TaxID=2972675 RepID=UPI002ADE8C5E|nr:type III-A CRISPR-associated RAMP protein Csm3 [Thermanaerothrix sp.]